MGLIWDRLAGWISVRQVHELLDDDLAYTTVMTVMTRLHAKGFLRRQRARRAWHYHPALSREGYAAATMADALNVAADRNAALLHFVADLSREEASTLRRLLDATEPS